MKKTLAFVLSLAALPVFAQRKNSAVIVVGRQLSAEDSLQIKEKYFNGLRAKTAGKLSEAELFFKEAVQISPQNDACLYELANLYHDQDEEVIAERYAREAVTVNSQNKWYWLLLAEIYKRTRNYDQLALVYKDLIQLEPNNSDYYFDKANSLLLLNKNKEAANVYQEIEKKFGNSNDLSTARQKLYQSTGSTDKAIYELDKLIKSNPSDVKNYISLSSIYEKKGEVSKAIEILETAKRNNGSNAYISLSLSELYTKAKRYDEAFEALSEGFKNPGLKLEAKIGILISMVNGKRPTEQIAQALQLGKFLVETHPNESRAFAIYGDLLYKNKRYTEAKEAFRKSISLDNQIYAAWDELLQIELKSNDFDQAIKDGEEALSLFPSQGKLYYLTAVAYERKGKVQQAISNYKNALSLTSDDKELQVTLFAALGDAYNSSKQFVLSSEAYDNALKLDPQNVYVLNNYAYYLSLRGENLSKAKEMAQKANELSPNNPSFEDTLAWVLFKNNLFKDALFWIEKALSGSPNGTTLLEHYGDILYHLGQKDKAVIQWQKAFDLGSTSETLKKKINEKKYTE